MPLPSDPKLAEIFNRFDVDQTKTIDKVELAQALQELNVQVTPDRPSMSGRSPDFFAHPNKWSNDRFSSNKTTTCCDGC